MVHFAVSAMRLPSSAVRERPKLQGAQPPSQPPKASAFGDICFRATATIIDVETDVHHMVVKGYLPSPRVVEVVRDACARIANTAQRCTEPELCVMRRNDAHACEGVTYEVVHPW